MKKNKVTIVKLQTLCREFETLFIKCSEYIQYLFHYVSVIVNYKIYLENIFQKIKLFNKIEKSSI